MPIHCSARLRILGFVCVLVVGFVKTSHGETLVGRVTVPETIRISPELQPFVDAMLQTSPTFRQQYERIVSTPKLIINARTDMTFMQRPFRARSCMRRYDSGLLVVSMDIAPGAEQGEWIAHEFEHVLEQLDGLSVSTMASRGHRETWFSSDQMVETSRATRAGRLVRAEMKGRKSHTDKFVN